jgi:predicted nucleic acid-binding protein
MSGPVVCNAGPLMVLAKLNLLHLLKELYSRVRYTRSVYDEAVLDGVRQGHEDAGALLIFLDQMGWSPEASLLGIPAELEEAKLDRGERDTLALALASRATLVLMDEAVGRQAARERGLAVRGSLGALVEAHRRGLIQPDQLRLYLQEMAQRPDIWMSRALVEHIRREVLGD